MSAAASWVPGCVVTGCDSGGGGAVAVFKIGLYCDGGGWFSTAGTSPGSPVVTGGWFA